MMIDMTMGEFLFTSLVLWLFSGYVGVAHSLAFAKDKTKFGGSNYNRFITILGCVLCSFMGVYTWYLNYKDCQKFGNNFWTMPRWGLCLF